MAELDVDIVSYSDTQLIVERVSPVEIGTNQLHLQLRLKAGDHTVWLEATRDDMIAVAQTSTDEETISLVVPQSKLLNLPPGEYVHSLILSESNGAIRTGIWRGEWEHRAGPTRWPQGKV